MCEIKEQPSFRKQFWQLVVYLGLGAILGILALEQAYDQTEEYIYWYLVIPLFFGVSGYALIKVLRFYFIHNEKHLVNVYLVLRVIKIICIIALIVTYLFILEKEHTRFFLPVIIGFYVIYLVWETKFFFGYERKLKKGKKA